jgi:dinuclear metal center YbgI/SA1388 family protein
MLLGDIVRYSDDLLNVRLVHDAPEAQNGLQVANAGAVSRIAAAVDLCAATVQQAASDQADLLIVHHGLSWSRGASRVDVYLERFAELVRHDIALYSVHLPLDCHPDLGNAAVLARRLGITLRGPFGTWHGQAIGAWGELELDRDELGDRLGEVLGVAPRRLLFGPQGVRRVGVVTGAAASLMGQAAQAGLDTFVTGEGNHHTYFEAEELGLNVYYGGHYATETLGVKALAEHLSTKFGLPWMFLDHPTGL